MKVNCILLVDDDESDNYFHEYTIKKADICHNLKIATDGAKALEYIHRAGQSGQTEEYPLPDIIFLDINMPRMNGFEFLEEYKLLDQRLRSGIVITMLTTSLNPSDREKALQTGIVSEFLNKPLTPEMLEEILKKYFTK
ncbi:MAG TPA: response regulator [Lentimicrobium sp.]|nr:response regulator [Lentimicrobium sp.]